MNTDLQWEKIKDIFQAALERNPSERQAYLDEACRNDPELRAKVESYLKAHEAAPSFLDRPIDAMIPKLFEGEPFESMADKAIGVYRLTRELGRGGMGMVYLAQRSDGEYEKTVAIKLIKRGLDSDEIVERFRHERQTLAMLEHPNIARLLEGGRTEEGLPFFVMDYVEGDPIDAYCDDHKFNITARLRLFQKVCAAVQYAHQNSIVHRDLKPNNILVTEEGELKLLDFGIAKVLSQEPSPSQTQAGVRLMTLEYASPEQVRGATITTLSDVYSLGVLLYRLLTGHSPYVLSETGSGALEKAILEQDPKKPSEAIHFVEHLRDDDGQIIESVTPETVSAARAGTPDKLKHRLAGDVDSIMLKALRKEPQERYSSVEQLSSDIEHHLSGHPVLARKGVWTYRASRFVRRHKFAVAAASVFLAMIIGFSISTQIQAQRIKQERDKAEQVSKFLVEIFQVSDPSEAKGDTITAREILDRGAQRIANELKDQPLVQATLMNTIGEVYGKLGLFDSAQRLFEQALAIRRQVLGNEHGDVAICLNNIAVALTEKGDYPTADSVFRAALAMRQRLFGDENLEVSESLNDLTNVLANVGDYAVAESLIQKAVAIRRKLLGNEHPKLATSLSNLAWLIAAKGDYTASEALYREILEIRRKAFGSDHPDVATSLADVADLLKAQEKLREAEPFLLEALTIRRKLFGNAHPDVALNLNNLGGLYYRMKNYGAADSLFRAALGIYQRLLDREHPMVSNTQHNLAVVFYHRGHYLQADSLFRIALATRRKTLGKDHFQTASTESWLGQCCAMMGRHVEAEALLLESYEILKTKTGEETFIAQIALKRIIDFYEARNKPHKAAEYRALLQEPQDVPSVSAK